MTQLGFELWMEISTLLNLLTLLIHLYSYCFPHFLYLQHMSNSTMDGWTFNRGILCSYNWHVVFPRHDVLYGLYSSFDRRGVEINFTIAAWVSSLSPRDIYTYTAEDLHEQMRAVLSDWGLDEARQSAITTDNAANILKACRDSKYPNITCFGHDLHLAIMNTINKDATLSRAVDACGKAVNGFSVSWQRQNALDRAWQRGTFSQTSRCKYCFLFP